MLAIRKLQLDALQLACDRELARELARHLRRHHPEAVATLDEAALLAAIERAAHRARAYGMEVTASISLFVVAAFVSHPDFDEHPLVQRYLRDPAILPDTRIRVTLANINDAEWRTVVADLRAPHTEGD